MGKGGECASATALGPGGWVSTHKPRASLDSCLLWHLRVGTEGKSGCCCFHPGRPLQSPSSVSSVSAPSSSGLGFPPEARPGEEKEPGRGHCQRRAASGRKGTATRRWEEDLVSEERARLQSVAEASGPFEIREDGTDDTSLKLQRIRS